MTAEQQAALVETGAAVNDKRTGRKCLNVPVFYSFNQDVAAGAQRLDFQQTVDSEYNEFGYYDFWWRGWKYIDTGAAFLMLVRFRLPAGYYLANDPWPIQQMNQRAITPELRVPAGTFLGIEATNNDAVSRKLKLIVWGVKRVFLE